MKRASILIALLQVAPLAAQDTEPNECFQAASAGRIALGDSVAGVIGVEFDSDYYMLALTNVQTVRASIDNHGQPSRLLPRIYPISPGGDVLGAERSTNFGETTEAVFTANADGDFGLCVEDSEWEGGPDFTYTLEVALLPPGPADPPTLLPIDPAAYLAFADLGDGRFASVSMRYSRTRVFLHETTGEVYDQVFEKYEGPYVSALVPSIARDAWGDLLVVPSTMSEVQRIVPDEGVETVYAGGWPSVEALYAAPNGDVWVTTNAETIRYDPFWVEQQRFDLAATAVAVDGAGVALLAAGTNIYRAESGGLVPIVQTGSAIGSMAFDADGRLYVYTRYDGVILLGPDYEPIAEPFARAYLHQREQLFLQTTAAGPRLVAAGDRQGFYDVDPDRLYAFGSPHVLAGPPPRVELERLPVSRWETTMGSDETFVLDAGAPGTWRLVHGVPPAGMTLSEGGVLSGIAGETGTFRIAVAKDHNDVWEVGGWFQIEVAQPDVSVDDAAAHLMGVPTLSETQLNFLDLQGNANGELDLADIHALMSARGIMPALEAQP